MHGISGRGFEAMFLLHFHPEINVDAMTALTGTDPLDPLLFDLVERPCPLVSYLLSPVNN